MRPLTPILLPSLMLPMLAVPMPTSADEPAGRPALGYAVLSDGSRRPLGPARGRRDGVYSFSRPCRAEEEALPVMYRGDGPAPTEPLTVVALEVRDAGRVLRVESRDFRYGETWYMRGLPVILHDEVVSDGRLIPRRYAPGTIRAYVRSRP